jgi:hypothetical protein
MVAFWSSARVKLRNEPAREHEFFSRARTNFCRDFFSSSLHLPSFPRGENREFCFRRVAIHTRTRIEIHRSYRRITRKFSGLRASSAARLRGGRTLVHSTLIYFAHAANDGSRFHCRVRRLDADFERAVRHAARSSDKQASTSGAAVIPSYPSRSSVTTPFRTWSTTKSRPSQRPHVLLSAFIPSRS